MLNSSPFNLGKAIWNVCAALLFSVLLISHSESYAQFKTDSLEKALPNITNDSEYVKTVWRIMVDYSYKDRDKSKVYEQKLRKVARRFRPAFFTAQADENAGNLNYMQSKYSEALGYYLKALRVYENTGELLEAAGLYHNIGNVMILQKKHDKAVEYISKAKVLNEQLQNTSWLVNNLTALGVIYMDLKEELDSAMLHFKAAHQMAMKTKDTEVQMVSNLNVLACYSKMKDFATANLWLAEIFKDTASLGFKLYKPNIYEKAGLIAFQLEHYAEAEKYYQIALKPSLKSRNLYRIKSIYQNLGEVYDRQGKHHLAYQNLRLSRRYADTIFNDNETRKIAALESKYQLEKKEQEKALMEMVKDEEIKRIQSVRVFWTALSFVILILLGVSFKAYKNKQKNLETISDKNRELEVLIDDKTNILNIVSHDLRTPLAKIQAATDIIGLNKETLAPTQQKNLSKIPNIIKEADHLISDLLLSAKMEESAQANEWSEVNVSELMRNLKQQFIPIASDKNIQLNFNLEEDVLFPTDREKLYRILDNLVSNAIKYAPENTEVTCNVQFDSNQMSIHVIDQGQGFSEADKTLLFQRFKKLSAQPIGKGKSYGLGLSIVKKLVDDLHGKIQLNSTLGNGSEFKVQLPNTTV